MQVGDFVGVYIMKRFMVRIKMIIYKAEPKQ